MGVRILVAEDDPKQASLIRLYLEREGHTVCVVGDGKAALEQVRTTGPDLVVLDVMMPVVDGLEVCRVLRLESEVPIVMLTARSTEADLLRGLDLGADDYLTKPYSPKELAARVRALLRRTRGAEIAPPVIRIGRVEIDPVRFEVRVDGVAVALTAREFAVLEVLVQEPGRVFTRVQIIRRAFGLDADVLHRTIDAHVVNLRRKLEAHPGGQGFLETVYGRGYRVGGPQS